MMEQSEKEDVLVEKGSSITEAPPSGDGPRDGDQNGSVVEGAEPPSEQPVQPVLQAEEDYSVFSTTQKKLIVTTASLASVFSPMATAIYCQIPHLV
jgi:hypothetical protein